VVEKTKKFIMERFDCKDCGDIEEYVGCKMVRMKNLLKLTQLVLMQSYNDKFELHKKSYRTPALAGLVLVAGKKEKALSPAMRKKFCSGTGKAMHVMQYSKPETYIQCKICLATCTKLCRITSRPCYMYLSTVWIQLNRD
jgi:hypothetical protein